MKEEEDGKWGVKRKEREVRKEKRGKNILS